MTRIIAITAAALLSMGAASHASAQPPQDGPSVSVGYSDLDLSTVSGRAALQGRINGAVDRVCPRFDIRRLELRQYERACRSAALASAERQLAAVYGHAQMAQASIKVSSSKR
jgi:UrcA family protein